MQRKAVTLAVISVLVLVAAASLSAANKYGVADQRTVEFRTPVRIAETVVPAGTYKVLHTMQGDDHIMVFSLKGSKPETTVRTKCSLVPLDKPVDQTGVFFKQNAKGEQVLVRMEFRGDKAAHVLAE